MRTKSRGVMIVSGFISGSFWGLVVGGVAVASASLVTAPPVPDVAQAAQPAGAPESPDNAEPQVADAPDAGATPAPSAAPTVIETVSKVTPAPPPAILAAPAAPETDAVVADVTPPPAPVEDTAQAAETAELTGTPETAETAEATATAESAAPVDSDQAPSVSTVEIAEPATPLTPAAPADLAQTLPSPEPAPAPAAIVAEEQVSPIETAPETAPALQPEIASSGQLSAPPPTPQASAIATATAEDPVLPTPQSQPPQPVAPDTAIAVNTTPAPAPADLPTAADAGPQDPVVAPQSVATPDVETRADAAPLAPLTPLSPEPPSAGDAAPDVAIATTEPDTADKTSQSTEVVSLVQAPAVSVLPGGNGNVRVNRLTGGGSTIAPSESTSVVPEETPASENEAVDTDAPAFERYAVASENPDNLPEMAVVLIDDGAFDGAVAAVAGIGFPVSVMIDPSADNATGKMQSYRAAGIEVGLLARLPVAATATDVAIFYEAALGVLPETAVALDAVTDTQAEPDVLNQTVAALAEDGRGLITVPRGLNSAQRVAQSEGLPSGAIFRFLDENDQDARVIQRFMDQAAFRARQTSGVILLGQVREETLQALTAWGAANRAGQVAMVPVTAVMDVPE